MTESSHLRTGRLVGFIGLGKMGEPMACQLARGTVAGVKVFDADHAHAAQLAKNSGKTMQAVTSLDALADCDLVITMLPNSQVTSAVIAGEGTSLCQVLRPGATIVDMGSSDPSETRRLHAVLNEKGMSLLDAPVSGSVAKAETGQLSIMVGGDSETLKRARPVLACMGSVIIPTGRVGSAHAMKALNNYVYAAGLLASCEALLMAQQMDLDLEVFVDILNAASGRNVATETKLCQFILSGSFSGGYALALQHKDLGVASQLAERAGLALPQLAMVESLWANAAQSLPPQADNTEIFNFLKQHQQHSEGEDTA
ncbi:NAD(P)-dependent oxidoreductase [Parahaliea mediterranea]|uniref:NAD(P)-dependent oxidoreductase n=1 Tax=Parahaliea mediterranea TaxID=651086 RepID=UPI000E2F8B44|nr:NAD(P)-dependent oxidoreductase [Parahaliea mediterranea]